MMTDITTTDRAFTALRPGAGTVSFGATANTRA
ncbi:hypothetical protein BKA24_001884 [Microbacterium marinum]|uniref:Uncharacterized protein n=1 Tax=Microbacterium marinum TaxID=421115 RepID=A0A7W7FJ85_9MICO|nr:hypothetical protein [Microbacterium marinum]